MIYFIIYCVHFQSCCVLKGILVALLIHAEVQQVAQFVHSRLSPKIHTSRRGLGALLGNAVQQRLLWGPQQHFMPTMSMLQMWILQCLPLQEKTQILVWDFFSCGEKLSWDFLPSLRIFMQEMKACPELKDSLAWGGIFYAQYCKLTFCAE